VKEPFIYMSDDATEEEVGDMDVWLRNRRFEQTPRYPARIGLVFGE
jgi:hypothetical protein